MVTTIQSPGNEPAEVPYYTGPDLARALTAAGQAATCFDDGPAAVRVRTLSVRIDFEGATCGLPNPEEPEYLCRRPAGHKGKHCPTEDEVSGMPDTPTLLRFDSESWSYGFDDCCHPYCENDPKAECAGPRVGMATFDDGFDAPMCEKHANLRAGNPV